MTGRILQNGTVIEVRQGDSFVIKLNFKKKDKDIDLSGAVVNMQTRRNDGSMVWDLPGTNVDVQKGIVALILTPQHTNIDVGDYKTDIQVKFPDGSVNTIFPQDVNKIGTFRITEQVTK